MYYVIFSKDAYLLARLCTELQMEYYDDNRYPKWGFHPFLPEYKWLVIQNKNPPYFYFMNWEGITPDVRLWVTESNYTKVLKSVLKNK